MVHRFNNTLFIIDFEIHRIVESFTIVGEVSIIGSNKSYFFTAVASALERGDTVFDILVVLLQLQYFLVGATVTKKIL